MRARINARFAELHTQRTDAETKLAALTDTQPQAADPAILDEIPYAGDIHALSADLKARLFEVFDLGILWDKTAGHATVTAVITLLNSTALARKSAYRAGTRCRASGGASPRRNRGRGGSARRRASSRG